jgi:hypothetical protein
MSVSPEETMLSSDICGGYALLLSTPDDYLQCSPVSTLAYDGGSDNPLHDTPGVEGGLYGDAIG